MIKLFRHNCVHTKNGIFLKLLETFKNIDLK